MDRLIEEITRMSLKRGKLTITETMGMNNNSVDCYHQTDGEKVVLTVENDVTSEVGIFNGYYDYLRAYKVFDSEDDMYKFLDSFICKKNTYGTFAFTFKVVDYLMMHNRISEIDRLVYAGLSDKVNLGK